MILKLNDFKIKFVFRKVKSFNFENERKEEENETIKLYLKK
jgi:hypothetical protein